MDAKQLLGRIPHKSLIASGLVAFTIIIVGVYMQRENIVLPSSLKNSPENLTLATTSASHKNDFVDRDSDNDGIPDWEERLNGSDPFLADTDGDGTFDGTEVSLGRNPTKKGPKDKLPVANLPTYATSSTDIMGIKKEFFAKYLKDEAKKIRQDTYKNIVKSVDVKKYTPTATLLDLNVSSDISPEAKKAYGNAFGKLIQKYTATPLRNEEEIFKVAMKVKKDSALKDLQYLIIVYTNFSKDLKMMPVPLPLAEHHLAIVNGYDGMARGLRGMQHLYSNPVDGAAGYQAYTRLRFDVLVGYVAIIAYFIQEQVTFEPHEPGYPFYYNTPPKGAESSEDEKLSAE